MEFKLLAFWRRIKDPGIKPRIFILMIYDAYFINSHVYSSNTYSIITDFGVSPNGNGVAGGDIIFLFGVVYCRKRDAYWDDEYVFMNDVKMSDMKSTGYSDNVPIGYPRGVVK